MIYAKKACKGNQGHLEPTFDATAAFNHYKELATKDSSYSTLPPWVAQVMPPPSKEELLPFDLYPITLGTIRRTLRNRSSSSTPGDNGIPYHHLKKMPSTHHFLATYSLKYSLGNVLPQKCGTKPRSNLYQKARTLLFRTTSGPLPSPQL